MSLGTEHGRGPAQYDCAIGRRHLGDLAVTESGGLFGRLLTEVGELSERMVSKTFSLPPCSGVSYIGSH